MTRGSHRNKLEDVEIETEPGVPIRVQLLRVRDRKDESPLVVYAKRPPTAGVYKLHGESKEIRFAVSLPGALEIWKY